MSIKKNKLRNRFKKPVSAAFEKINSSIEFDKNVFQILPISLDRGPKKNSINFFKEYNIEELDIYFDDKNNIPREAKAVGLPYSIFINQNGNEIAKLIGPAEWDSDYFVNFIRKTLN